jgi:hypothetical protein
MKIRAASILWLFVFVWPILPVLGADRLPPFKRLTVPGQLTVQSVDEQDISPSEKENLRAEIRRIKEHKVIPVSDQKVPDFAVAEAEHSSRKAQLAELIAGNKLKFSPINVDATSLKGERLIGSIPSGAYTDKSWSGLSRMFQHPHLGRVILEETDLAKTGGGANFTKEMINADVNGAPAILLSMQGGPKKSETSVAWFSNGVLYLLRAPGVDDKSREALLEIARGIYK